MDDKDVIPAPSRLLAMMEARVFFELGLFLSAAPLLTRAPMGDGHSVIVLPGMMGDDASTQTLRSFLRSRGYDVHGWGQGPNHGLRAGVENKMLALVKSVAERSGRKVSLVGWSLGGIYARLLGMLVPEHVRSVLTMGSAFAGSPYSTNAWQIYEALSGHSVESPHVSRVRGVTLPLHLPASSIFSRSDGVCAWQGCVAEEGPLSESIEVRSSHTGMGFHPAVLFAVSDRLAQPEGRWKPFHRRGWRSLVYPDPQRTVSDAWIGFNARGLSLA